MELTKSVSKNDGFGLIELMVSVTIMSVIGLALNQMFSHQLKATKGIQQGGDYTDLLNNARLVLASPTLCKCNLALAGAGGVNFPESNASTQVVELNDLKVFDSACTAAGTLVKKASEATPGDLQVTTLQLKDFSKVDAGNYVAKLHLEVTKPAGSMGGSGRAKDFDLLFKTTTSGGNVTLNECETVASRETATTASPTPNPSASPSSSPTPSAVQTNFGGSLWVRKGGSSWGDIYTVPAGKVLMISNIAGDHCEMQSNSRGGSILLTSNAGAFLAPFYFQAGTAVDFIGDCQLSGLLLPVAAGIPGGSYWQRHPAGPWGTVYTVPEGKVLVINYIGHTASTPPDQSTDQCRMRSGSDPFIEVTPKPGRIVAPYRFEAGTKLDAIGACEYSGYLLSAN